MTLAASVVTFGNSCCRADAHLTEECELSLEGQVIDSSDLFHRERQEWQDSYNDAQPRGSLGGQTPYERLPQKTTPCEAMCLGRQFGGGDGT